MLSNKNFTTIIQSLEQKADKLTVQIEELETTEERKVGCSEKESKKPL